MTLVTPRTTRLVRVPDLQAMHRAVVACAAGESNPCAVLVPTRAAAVSFQETLTGHVSNLTGTRPAPAPDLLTRDELYARWRLSLPVPPPMLSALEREVLFQRAAETAKNAGARSPFRMRAGLVVEILAFYDELKRGDRTIEAFDRLMTDSLEPTIDVDRGAERLFRQTRFLAAAFSEFERLVAGSGRVDEHRLRELLLDHAGPPAFPHLVVTVGDQSADPHGLWTADYDLLARMSGVTRIDVVATENVLASGFHQRLQDLLPGIAEHRDEARAAPPVLVAPERNGGDAAASWFVSRDREEELVRVARVATAARCGVVYQRPLPYVYLARRVFGDAGLAYRTLDALPLAAEPFAAAIDLVLAFLISEANRTSIVDLLGSPHWRFDRLGDDRRELTRQVAALDAWLREVKYFGGWDRLARLAGEDGAPRALLAAVDAASALRPVLEAPTASAQLHALLAFIEAHERVPESHEPWLLRHEQARSAIRGALESLADAHRSHDDAKVDPDALVATIRRWIEGHTFPHEGSGNPGEAGVTLLDQAAAAYANLDELHLLGLVEQDWPERGRRSIFYPLSLLAQLGWPNEADRLAAARARFLDLLRLPRVRVLVSTFTLEDDAIVPPSPLLEELESSGLSVDRSAPRAAPRVLLHESLMRDVTPVGSLSGSTSEWLALRAARSSAESDRFHGVAGPRQPAAYAVSHLERYLSCPFKYFSAYVLKLHEEREDESGLTPQERGQLLHEVFERFFDEWHRRGGTRITAANLDDALALFEPVAEATIARLPEADRALERNYLLGSAAAAGLAERAFLFEIEHDVEVVERLLEHPLEGEFTFTGDEGARRVRIRAKADRIDLLEDGTLRVIDYKLGRAPKHSRSLQLPIYGVCAEQHLAGRHGRGWTVSRAGYVAFKEKNAFVALGGSTSLAQAFSEGQQRLLTAVAGIERGEFPVRPDEPFLCTRCGYSGVCRKDYVGDE